MVNFIEMNCRKNSEEKNKNKTEQKLPKVEAWFIWLFS